MEHVPKIDNFEIMGCLGRGGMSTVWKARQVSLDRLVAIKVLDARMATDSEDVESFYEEARSAGRLRHPGIVQVYDVGFADGRYYFVMELVDGYTIGDWVRRRGKLPDSEILVLGECVGSALRYAWREFRMVHCDVKPDNVMIDADGTVKVTDLGLARTIFNMQEDSGVDEVAGTPAYMSPEQVMGDSVLDCRSDIYSLGAMFYHLATGKMLFEGQDESTIMEQQVNGRVCDAIELEHRLTPAFCALVEKMLAKEPAKRHGNWKAVVGDIQRVSREHYPANLIVSGLSTMKRNRERHLVMTRYAHELSRRAEHGRKARKTFPLAAVLTVFIMALVAVGVLRHMRGKSDEILAGVRQRTDRLHVDDAMRRNDVDEALNRAARKVFDAAAQWEREHPRQKKAAAWRYRRVAELYPGCALAEQALKKASELEQTSVDGTPATTPEGVMKALDKAAAARLASGDAPGAQAVYADYQGAFERETRNMRKIAAMEVWENSRGNGRMGADDAGERDGEDISVDNAVNGDF